MAPDHLAIDDDRNGSLQHASVAVQTEEV